MSLLERFRASMVMDYEKWHEGVGYDLDALDAMSDEDRARAEKLILQKGVSDWRDIEALGRIGSSGAFAAILGARQSSNSELRLWAHQYGPPPQAADRESAILGALQAGEPFGGYSQAIDQAAEFPSAQVIAALLQIARGEPGVKAYHAAAVLDFISGQASSHHGIENRELLLKFLVAPSPERDHAFAELASRFV